MEISEDKKAILAELEPGKAVLIEGEAGTGKTLMGVLCGQKLLMYVSPWQKCLYLTFSKLAKRQIGDCIQEAIEGKALDPDLASRMDVLNYHSLWWQLIAKQYSFLGISRQPVLCTYNETRKLAVKAIKELPFEVTPTAFLTNKGSINQKKGKHLVDVLSGMAAVYAQWGAENFGRTAVEFVGCNAFLSWSKDKIFDWNRTGLFSHAETVCWAHSLLKSHPNELLWMREAYPIVVIDEFQDTDVAQWEIVQLMVPKTLIAMADAAQTIHIWRGADPKRLEQFILFGQTLSTYQSQEVRKLSNRHRSPKQMSDHRNITWRELKETADPEDAIQSNLAKRQAKAACKKTAKAIKRSEKTVGILCLTNDIADEITCFLRSRQIFNNGGYDSEMPCVRLGVENSPPESARECVLNLLEQSASAARIEVQSLLANDLLQQLLPCKINTCSRRSRDDNLRERWDQAGCVVKLLNENFGWGLRQLSEFIIVQARTTNCFCDSQVIGCLKHVGDMVSRAGIRGWRELSPEDKRKGVDAAVLQYENALANSRITTPVSVMTIHQSKGREFATVVVPWFTSIPWSPDEPGWNTSNLDHQNLFHTACTRAKEEAIVIFPKGQQAIWPNDIGRSL